MSPAPVTRDPAREEGLVPPPPEGRDRLQWIGPGVLWALAALATGELLFTPRVGAIYGYTLVWAFVLALLLKYVVTREIGRYSVATGRGLLTGYAGLPGPRRWAVWVVVVPQLVVGVAAIAGIASAAGSALAIAVPAPPGVLGVVVVAAAAALVLRGRYSGVEWVSRVLGLALAVGSVVAALLVGPDLAGIAAGALPGLPADLVVSDVLPWLGFLSNGAAGLIWYSYWVTAKGVGVAGVDPDRRPDPRDLGERDVERVRSWLRTMSLDSGLAVAGVGVITLAFLVLGAELLRPEGIVPAEADVARDLTRLFSDVFGRVGFWLMVGGLVSAFFTATLTNQDGWKRLYRDGLRRLVDGTRAAGAAWAQPRVIALAAVLGWLGLLPAALLLAVGDPVLLLTLAGSIEAVHIPFVAALTLWLNRRDLPPPLRPGRVMTGLLVVAVLFFGAFALGYLVQQVTG